MNDRIAKLLIAGALSLALATAGWPAAASGQAGRRVVLIAGLKSHGPEGNGIHDYGWSARLIQTMLENSNIADRVQVTCYLNGWPADTSELEQADTIMIISDGRDGENGREAPHLASASRVALIDRAAQRGCGVVTFHFSTFAPDALSEQALRWYGGYFDWETDGKREWYSDITTIEAEVQPTAAGHPVLRGVKPFVMRDEFYFDIRFPVDHPGWVPLWTVDALPASKPNGKVVSWAVQRDGGGRGFGTTCGHFYENWQQPDFRRTILNALAWTAHVEIPAGGVEAAFFTREEIAGHLAEPDLLERPDFVDDERYANEPYWYKPGHPLRPAEATAISTLPGFTAERVVSVPEAFGSWTALCVDSKGRLIAAAQHLPGLYRVTPAPAGDALTESTIEKLAGVADQVGWSQGLLYAFDSLYVTVSEGNDVTPTGVYRLRDRNGDDQFDELQPILLIDAQGEHGLHNLVVGPDQQSLYFICGNGTRLPTSVERRRPVASQGPDHLLPAPYGSSRHTTAGWVCRLRPDGRGLELFAAGLRNSFDLAFNQRGDLFTFDSDMEADLGTPWYRPTRICHLVSGAEFGWRGGAAKWPAHYEDSVPAAVDVGPSSPTGLVFGYGAKFPAAYQRALFACDWTFATIHAVHLVPEGGTYTGKIEQFVGGRGLPVTDAVIGGDGAMYFTVGGRRLGSAIYRVRYTGAEPTTAASREETVPRLHALRRQLETFHGQPQAGAIESVWQQLGDSDRAIRFAARVALETQEVGTWRERALSETALEAQLTALLALVRQGSRQDCVDALECLQRIDLAAQPAPLVLRTLRVYELALGRCDLGGDTATDVSPELLDSVRRQLRQLLTAGPAAADSAEPAVAAVDRELIRLLCYLNDGRSIDLILQRMADDNGQRPVLGSGYFVRNPKYGLAVSEMLQAAPLVDRMHDAQMLLWVDDGWTTAQRRQYAELVARATDQSRGGREYAGFWDEIFEASLKDLPGELRRELESIRSERKELAGGLPEPIGPGGEWTLEELLELVDGGGLARRNFANGQRAFAAAQCISCHRFNGQGTTVGPDLSSIGQRFTVRDLLDSTVNPSKVVSDQYRVTMLVLTDGRTLSGRIVSRDATQLQLASNLLRPTQVTAIAAADVDEEMAVPISTMPTKLLDPLNADEVLDLISYLVAGGNPEHVVFGK